MAAAKPSLRGCIVPIIVLFLGFANPYHSEFVSFKRKKEKVSDVCVCMLVVGGSNYFRASRQSIRSILERSDFDVCIGTDDPDRIRPVSDRVRLLRLPAPEAPHRAQPFPWNHSNLWDSDFPRPGAHIMHFSNFCHGPQFAQISQMTYYRHFYNKATPATEPSTRTAET